MKQIFRPVVFFTTALSGTPQNIFKTFYLNYSYIVFYSTLIKSCINRDFLTTMYLFNNALSLILPSSIQGKFVSLTEEVNRFQGDDFKKKIQIVQQIPINKFLIELINHIFKTLKNAF